VNTSLIGALISIFLLIVVIMYETGIAELDLKVS
jgi:hypothetical protein